MYRIELHLTDGTTVRFDGEVDELDARLADPDAIFQIGNRDYVFPGDDKVADISYSIPTRSVAYARCWETRAAGPVRVEPRQ